MKKICKDCGKEFELTDSEIGFYKSKGYELPKRCKSCRDKKNGKKSSNGNNARKTSNINDARNVSNGNSIGRVSNNNNVGNSPIGNNGPIFLIIAAILIVCIIGVVAINRSLKGNEDNSYSWEDSSVQSTTGDSTTVNIVDLTDEITDALSNSDISNDMSNDESGEASDAVTNETEAPKENESETVEVSSDAGSSDNDDNSAEIPSAEEKENTEATAEDNSEGTAPVTVNYVFRNSKLLNQHYEKHGIEMGFDSAESYQAAASAVINNPNALSKIEAEDGDFVYYVEDTNEFVILSTDGYIRTYFLPSGGKAYYDRQ